MASIDLLKSYTFSYKKLVRDRIPDIINKEGWLVKGRVLSPANYRLELKRKMIEEANELLQARTKEDVALELADILELVQCIAKNYSLDSKEIKSIKTSKQKHNGSFRERRFIDNISYQPGADARWLKYHLKQSDKYPLIP